MKIEKTVVFGFEPALRGMRNAMESWDKADSDFHRGGMGERIACHCGDSIYVPEQPYIGPNDMKLVCNLVKAGPSHRKFTRQIVVWADFTLPLYMWSEFDTYHGDPVAWDWGTQPVRDSCSTMHKLGSRELTPVDFEDDDPDLRYLDRLNEIGKLMRVTSGDAKVKYLRKLKKKLPSSYLLKSTYSMNYETALTMYAQRKNHRLPEWSGAGGICEWIKTLPYMVEFIAAYE